MNSLMQSVYSMSQKTNTIIVDVTGFTHIGVRVIGVAIEGGKDLYIVTAVEKGDIVTFCAKLI